MRLFENHPTLGLTQQQQLFQTSLLSTQFYIADIGIVTWCRLSSLPQSPSMETVPALSTVTQDPETLPH